MLIEAMHCRRAGGRNPPRASGRLAARVATTLIVGALVCLHAGVANAKDTSSAIPAEFADATAMAEREGRALHDADLAGAVAADSAVASARSLIHNWCDLTYKSIPVTEDGTTRLYFIGSDAKSRGVAVGRHFRVDGDRVLDSTVTCLTLVPPPASARESAMFVTHLLTLTPTEFHVYLSLREHRPLYVGTRTALWSVAEGRIRYVKPMQTDAKGPVAPAPAPAPVSAHPVDPRGCPMHGDTEAASWDADCASAIGRATDPKQKATLLYRRGYVHNGREHYAEALRDLDAACALVHDDPVYLHERAYAENAIGAYAAALADLDAQARLQPAEPSAYKERALSRHALGDMEGSLQDRRHVVELLPWSADALLGQAEAHLWVGELDQARLDVQQAAKRAGTDRSDATTEAVEQVQARVRAWSDHAPGPDPGANCRRAARPLDDASPTLVGDCTAEFFRATTGPEKAAALTNRSIGWIRRQKSRPGPDALDDALLASVLDPGNADVQSNYGYALLLRGRDDEARTAFDRSLSIQKGFAPYAGRAATRLHSGDLDGAIEDATASNALRPNINGYLTLGDVALRRKDEPAARRYWLAAYHLDPTSAYVRERLRQVGVEQPERE